MKMMRDLKTIREEWEKKLIAKSVLHFLDTRVVILENEKTHTYCIHRYFLIGENWVCSVDKANLTLDEVFNHLEYIVIYYSEYSVQ